MTVLNDLGIKSSYSSKDFNPPSLVVVRLNIQKHTENLEQESNYLIQIKMYKFTH